eukprot:9612-Chlamydomonas_euryale.AAC.2
MSGAMRKPIGSASASTCAGAGAAGAATTAAAAAAAALVSAAAAAFVTGVAAAFAFDAAAAAAAAASPPFRCDAGLAPLAVAAEAAPLPPPLPLALSCFIAAAGCNRLPAVRWRIDARPCASSEKGADEKKVAEALSVDRDRLGLFDTYFAIEKAGAVGTRTRGRKEQKERNRGC